MARAGKFAEARNRETGEVVAQFFYPKAEDDAVSIALRILTRQLQLLTGQEHGGGFGGPFGYGVDFENDVFEMRYDRQNYDCTCGATETLHTAVCREVWHAWNSARLTYMHPRRSEDEQQKEFDRLIAEGTPRMMASLMASSPAMDMRDVFARSDEYTRRYPPPTCDCPGPRGGEHAWLCNASVSERPQFLHKPSGFAVRWYKYIGRDMTLVSAGEPPPTLADVLTDCLKSIGGPEIDEAARDYAEAERDSRERHDKIMKRLLSDSDES